MTPDKPEETASRFTKRQKIIAAIVVIVLLVLVWQLIGIFGGGSSAVPELKAPPAVHPTAQAQPARAPGSPVASQPGAVPVASQPAVAQQTPTKAVLPSDQGPAQQEQQKLYVDTLNQLQMLKLQKDIDETKQSIAAAKLATATAEKNITDLFTKPVPAPTPQPSAADYAKMLVGQNADSGTPTTPPPLQTPQPPAVQYIVITVSMRLGHWTAVLGSGGKLYSVSVGDILPLDGSEVVAIGKSGVVLKKNGTRRRINVVNSL